MNHDLNEKLDRDGRKRALELEEWDHEELARHCAFVERELQKPDSHHLRGRIYGLQEAAVIAGETSIGLAIYERLKLIQANSAMEGPAANTLWVGTEGGEVVINHPDIDPDENGVGHIIFSPEQAESLAKLLLGHAQEARRVGMTQ
jgi:hypothetical protein